MSKRRRGAYRGIFSALIDDPDFQKLSPDARLVLLVARQCKDAGPSAIFRYYPDQLAEQTGLPRTALTMALAELTGGGWIEEDGVILWVRNGLRYDPFTSPANLNQREGIISHLKTLPKREIVANFCRYYGFDIPFTSNGTSHETYHPEQGIGSREVGSRDKGTGNRESVAPWDGAPSPRTSRTGPTWEAYSAAYEARYGAPPIRNAKINGMLTYFVQRVPLQEAPAIARHYVQSSFRLYVSAAHPVDLLLRDAEKLRTEWVTGKQVTESAARDADQLKGRGDRYRGVIEELRQEDHDGES